MPEEKEFLTKEKFDEFSKELDYLRKTKRKEIAQNLEYAKALGDLAENSEYHEARDMQANIEDRIAHLEKLLKNAVLVSPHEGTSISVGSTVTVEKDKNSFNYIIVSTEEADYVAGKISTKSPLGAMLLGKKKGDSFVLKTPSGSASYKITNVK